MRGEGARAEQVLAGLADGQFGVLARWQLMADAALHEAWNYRIRTGRLVVLHRGVCAYGHRRLTANGHRLAAVLAYGPTAVLSHLSAGAVLELLSTDQVRVDVTVPGTSRHVCPGIRVHRTRDLRAAEIIRVGPIPVTTVTRTLLDLAGSVSPPRLRRAVMQAQHNGTLDLSGLQAGVDRHPWRRGTRALRTILDDYRPAPKTRSELERDFLDLVASAGLPPPLVNTQVAGYEVDVFWPQWKLVVELDSRTFHSDPWAFESDPVRDARLQRLGCRVLRVTWKRLMRHPRAVLADIRALAAV